VPSTSLQDVIGNYLDGLRLERAFDEPFKALLRSHGYFDIHFVHGNVEFGKDFVAKRIGEGGQVEQWAFQSKAGNISSEWREIRGQVDELRLSELSHPSFDASLQRRTVLVLTGRLRGNAPLAVQEYRTQVATRSEQGFDIWDRETLIEMLAVHPEAALAGQHEGALLQALGSVDAGELSDRDVEVYSRRWYEAEFDGSAALLECAVLATRLQASERFDLACLTALAAVRAAWARGSGGEPSSATIAASDAVT
jgi:hypothetical protein